MTISHQCPPPDLEHKAWEIEVEALKNKLHEQKKLGLFEDNYLLVLLKEKVSSSKKVATKNGTYKR